MEEEQRVFLLIIYIYCSFIYTYICRVSDYRIKVTKEQVSNINFNAIRDICSPYLWLAKCGEIHLYIIRIYTTLQCTGLSVVHTPLFSISSSYSSENLIKFLTPINNLVKCDQWCLVTRGDYLGLMDGFGNAMLIVVLHRTLLWYFIWGYNNLRIRIIKVLSQLFELLLFLILEYHHCDSMGKCHSSLNLIHHAFYFIFLP